MTDRENARMAKHLLYTAILHAELADLEQATSFCVLDTWLADDGSGATEVGGLVGPFPSALAADQWAAKHCQALNEGMPATWAPFVCTVLPLAAPNSDD